MSEIIYTNIEGKAVKLMLSGRAQKHLLERKQPVYIGLELYFSCFVKKIIVAFEERPDRDVFEVADKLFLYFMPVQSKSCNIHDLIGRNSPTLIDLPVVKRRAIIPTLVKLDYKQDKWIGDFSWGKKHLKRAV